VKPALLVEVTGGPWIRTRADLAVAGVFEADRPLRGDAGRADWRLLSELMSRGAFSGRAGEAILVPTDGRLRAERLLVVGLGERNRAESRLAEDLAEEATSRAVELGAASLVVSLPVGASRSAALVESAEALVGGVLSVLAARPARLRLRVLVEDGRARTVTADLRSWLRGRRGVPVPAEVREGVGSAGADPAPTRPASPRGSRQLEREAPGAT
jgi:hypothetical protein